VERNPEPLWRRRLRLRWYRMLACAGIALYYTIILGSNWAMYQNAAINLIVVAAVIINVFFSRNPSEDDPPPGSDWVCLTFAGPWKPTPFVGDLLSVFTAIVLAYLASVISPSPPPGTQAVALISVLMIATGLSVTFRRRGPRRRYIPLVEYNLARDKIDPALSYSKNLKRFAKYAWSTTQKNRDIVSAVLGLAVVTMPSISPYPRDQIGL
jgi:hypothetical protein